MTSFVNNLLLR